MIRLSIEKCALTEELRSHLLKINYNIITLEIYPTMFTTVKLEDYFDFLAEDDIRLKGHRIGIEDVINYYLEGYTPEEILKELPSLNLEKVYATITYYLHNRSQLDFYLLQLINHKKEKYQEFIKNPSALIQRLKAEKIKRTQITAK